MPEKKKITLIVALPEGTVSLADNDGFVIFQGILESNKKILQCCMICEMMSPHIPSVTEAGCPEEWAVVGRECVSGPLMLGTSGPGVSLSSEPEVTTCQIMIIRTNCVKKNKGFYHMFFSQVLDSFYMFFLLKVFGFFC